MRPIGGPPYRATLSQQSYKIRGDDACNRVVGCKEVEEATVQLGRPEKEKSVLVAVWGKVTEAVPCLMEVVDGFGTGLLVLTI